jgi:hypothetical protein
MAINITIHSSISPDGGTQNGKRRPVETASDFSGYQAKKILPPTTRQGYRFSSFRCCGCYFKNETAAKTAPITTTATALITV